MSVIIHGLDMPKRTPIQAMIYPDGRVFVRLHSGKTLVCRAVSVPSHMEAEPEKAIPIDFIEHQIRICEAIPAPTCAAVLQQLKCNYRHSIEKR